VLAIRKDSANGAYGKIGKTVEQPAFQKKELVCYCFGYTREDIEQDFAKNHKSLIMDKIAAEKKAGGCDCATRKYYHRQIMFYSGQIIQKGRRNGAIIY